MQITNISDLKAHREIRTLIRYGVSKEVAKEVVEVAKSVSKDNISRAIGYAVTLHLGHEIGKRIEKEYAQNC